jgi:2-oxoglutarate dehydrogenase E1 component
MEGQGPEHSSARWERYLQACAEDNWQVCNFTTPANYFHGLRRQIRRNYRKPLIVMTPKSLLRHRLAVSPLADFGPGSRFRRVLPETEKLLADGKIRRVVLCSGKVYFDLFEERAKRGINDVALLRVEQLYPWPKETLIAQLQRYNHAELVWCQEEPANMGPWMFVDRRLHYILEEIGHPTGLAFYVGRNAAAAPATGSHKTHVQEQALLMEQALVTAVERLPQPFSRVTKLSTVQNDKQAAKA